MSKKLYNPDQKDRYLEYREKSSEDVPQMIRSIFHKTYGLEEIYKKDVADFNRESVDDLMFYLGLGTYASIAFFYYCLIDYVDWCIANGLVKDGMNHFRDIEYNSLSKYINKKITEAKILSRDDLLEQIDLLDNPRDRVFLLSCFEFGVGREYSDFLNMEMKDVDKANHILHLKNRDVEISNEWIAIAEEAANTYEATTNVHDFEKPFVRKLKLENTPKIYKNTVNVKGISDDEKLIQKRMARVFVSIKKTLGLNQSMKAQSIINSGRIHYVNTKAKELGISGEEFVKLHRSEIENQFYVLCNPIIFLREYGSYLI